MGYTATDAAWIGPDPTGSTWPIDPIGDYYYFIRFSIDLTGFADPSSVRITGSWATDNGSRILLNGQDTGYSKEAWGFSQLDSFVLTGFRSGVNDILFKVTNDAGPSGLLVADLMLTETPIPNNQSVPDSATVVEAMLMMAAPLFLMVVVRRCRWLSRL